MQANQDVTKAPNRFMQTFELLGQCFIRSNQSGYDQSKKGNFLARRAQYHPAYQGHAQHERIQHQVTYLRSYVEKFVPALRRTSRRSGAQATRNQSQRHQQQYQEPEHEMKGFHQLSLGHAFIEEHAKLNENINTDK